MPLKIISAGAGSGKTYTLTRALTKLLTPDENGIAQVRPNGIIATTFTNKAAAELQDRVRIHLLEEGLIKEADELGQALIGTVHAIGAQLLKRFAFEAGISPQVEVMADEDSSVLFNNSLSAIITPELLDEMDLLSERLSLGGTEGTDWRKHVQNIVEKARANNFNSAVLEESKQYSIDTFFELLPDQKAALDPIFQTGKELYFSFHSTLNDAIEGLEGNTGDTVKKRETVIKDLKKIRNTYRNKDFVSWNDWHKLSVVDPGKKSAEFVIDLIRLAERHLFAEPFRDDIRQYITKVFDTAILAIDEFQSYKKQRGLIDYTDMETGLLTLLQNPVVRKELGESLDLLLVDEFQDTNPIQLQIFLLLTDIAKQAIWVGDPKQSIYGFRGAEPKLMQAVIDYADEEETLGTSYRSREDIVNSVNAIFVKAFEGILPPEKVALHTASKNQKINDPAGLGLALQHWHFENEDGSGSKGNTEWFSGCVARATRELLESGLAVRDSKSPSGKRPIRGSDIAILCRTNHISIDLAEGLNAEGLQASTAQGDLLVTKEAQLLLACLEYLYQQNCSLAVAKILLLGGGEDLNDILVHRLAFLKDLAQQENVKKRDWGGSHYMIQQLDQLRAKVRDYAAGEITQLVIDSLDLFRIVATWGNRKQRHANINVIRTLAMQYESSCLKLHSSSTLGGFLLWLQELYNKKSDQQAVSTGHDTIEVMTYHRSKGLEWPVVICMNLDNKLNDKLFEPVIVNKSAVIDLKNPLANRLIRFWVSPYDDKISTSAIHKALATHPAKVESEQRALEEEARLLYVALTRPRDYLVFPTRKVDTLWLNRVWHKNEKTPSLHEQEIECQWAWNEQAIYKDTKVLPYPSEFEGMPAKEEEIVYFSPRKGAVNHTPLFGGKPSVQNEPDFMLPAFRTGKMVNYANPLDPPFELDEDEYDQVLQALFTATGPNTPANQFLEIADTLVKDFKITSMKAQELANHAMAFYKEFSAVYQTGNWSGNVFLKGFVGKQLWEINAGGLLVGAEQKVIVHHEMYAGESSRWRTKTQEWIPSVAAGSVLLSTNPEQALKDKQDGAFIGVVHFARFGGWIEIL